MAGGGLQVLRQAATIGAKWIQPSNHLTLMYFGCIKLKDRRWCYEHIPPEGNRAEMLRIRYEPSQGVYIGASYYYMVDFDLDGLVDVGSTTQIDALDRPPRAPIGNVIGFFDRSTKRGERSQPEYQKMYDEGLEIALKYFGE